MIGLEPKVRREARSKRPPLGSTVADPTATPPEATEPGADAS
jgi:hypothetical protein